MTIKPYPHILDDDAVQALDDLLGEQRADTCELQRRQPGRDATGAPSGTWATAQTVACRVSKTGQRGSERVSGGRFGPDVPYEVALPRETGVDASQRIRVNGETFEVVEVADAVSFGFELIVGCRSAA